MKKLAYLGLAALSATVFFGVRHLAMPKPAMAQIVAAETLSPVPLADMLSQAKLTFTNLTDGMSRNCYGGVLPTRARLNFYDKLQATGLTWYLAIKGAGDDADQPPRWSRIYTGQRFVVNKGATVAPTFAQDVIMPPGAYQVSCGVRNDLGNPVAADTFFARVYP